MVRVVSRSAAVVAAGALLSVSLAACTPVVADDAGASPVTIRQSLAPPSSDPWSVGRPEEDDGDDHFDEGDDEFDGTSGVDGSGEDDGEDQFDEGDDEFDSSDDDGDKDDGDDDCNDYNDGEDRCED